MSETRKRFMPRSVVVGAVALGLVGGTYGVAAAASGSTSATTAGSSTVFQAAAPTTAPSAGQPWGPQRSDETPLTGDALAKVTALATEKVPGGTVVRVETDADGNAAYEAHMIRSDGSPVTVYVSKQLEVVSVQSGMPHPPGGVRLAPAGASA